MESIRYPVVKSESDRVWMKYCGFYGLSIEQFMTIQERLLLQQLEQVAGFTRISEKTIVQAIANVGLNYEDWSIRKEVNQGKPTLHLYIELNDDYLSKDVAPVLHSELKNIDPGYCDLDLMMDIRPLEVTVLRPGTFRDYYIKKRKRG